jgi:hypothetical protein
MLKIPHTIPFLLPADETFDIGVETRTPVHDTNDQVPCRCNGTINQLTCHLGPVQLAEEDHRKRREAVVRARDEGRTRSGGMVGATSCGAARLPLGVTASA